MSSYTETLWRDKPFRRALPRDPAWIDCGDGFERAVCFEPGFNSGTRHWGVGAMKLRFLLRGPLGATQFLMAAGWTPGRNDALSAYPAAWDLGYHSLTPRYDDQPPFGCRLLPGGQCYYDGSGSAADPVLERFIVEGEPAVWRALHEAYRNWLTGDSDE